MIDDGSGNALTAAEHAHPNIGGSGSPATNVVEGSTNSFDSRFGAVK
jgi:hypothetical protein